MFDARKLIAALLLCAAPLAFAGKLASSEKREGDEIVACGRFFHTGTRVVLWMDPGGYDAYRVERRFVPLKQASWENSASAHLESPNRYGRRDDNLTPAEIERTRGGGWDFPMLQKYIDQFVWHYDVDGCSRACFEVLHDKADLSVHFMLDLDGTIYQTLDLKEDAWHATTSNDRSIGIEIANVGAYTSDTKGPMDLWFKTNAKGRVSITIPARFGSQPEYTKDFVGHPARREQVVGDVQHKVMHQYDYTPQQYKALIQLTATLCTMFPNLKCDYPREADGKLMRHKIPDHALEKYQGILGHYHVQTDKTDPGPALQWDYVVDNARALMKLPPVRNTDGKVMMNPPRLLQDN